MEPPEAVGPPSEKHYFYCCAKDQATDGRQCLGARARPPAAAALRALRAAPSSVERVETACFQALIGDGHQRIACTVAVPD